MAKRSIIMMKVLISVDYANFKLITMKIKTLGGYHNKHEKGAKGHKGNKWEEHGHFKKGHSTKGQHEIHKLDESKKEKKFFDEDGDEA